MGGHMSKKIPETSSDTNLSTDRHYYEAACKLDVDLQSFDTTLQARTNQLINTPAVGVEVALSFDSLKEVIECFLGMNQDVVKVILDCKKDILGNQKLFEFVKEYFENSLRALNFFTVLEKCLTRARYKQLLILGALQHFEEETEQGGKHYARTLQELKNFKAADDPFNKDDFEIFQSVYEQQRTMYDKLQKQKNKLDKKLKHIRSWRKVSTMIIVATFAAVRICSVVAAAIADPHVATALSAAASYFPIEPMVKWIDSLLKNYENIVEGQEEVIGLMHDSTFAAKTEMDNIWNLIDRLKDKIDSLKRTANLATDVKTVKSAIEEIKMKLELFRKNLQDLEVHVDNCSRCIIEARTVVLQRITKHPHN